MKKKEFREFRRGSFAYDFQRALSGERTDSPTIKCTHRQLMSETGALVSDYYNRCTLLIPPTDWRPEYTCAVVIPTANAPYQSTLGKMTLIPLTGNISVETLRQQTSGKIVAVKDPITEATEIQATVPHRLTGKGSALIIFDQTPLRWRALLLGSDPISQQSMWDHHYYSVIATGFAQTMRTLRQEAGLEIHEVATMLNIDRAQVSRLESGGTNAGEHRRRECGQLLGFDVEQLLVAPWYSKVADENLASIPINLGDKEIVYGRLKTASVICTEGQLLVQSETQSGKDTEIIGPLSAYHVRECNKLTVKAHDGPARFLIVKQ